MSMSGWAKQSTHTMPRKEAQLARKMLKMKGAESSTAEVSEENRLRTRPLWLMSKKAQGAARMEPRSRSWTVRAALRPPLAKEKARTRVRNELARARRTRIPR